VISIEECRKYLEEDGETDLIDEQVEKLRGSTYGIVEIALEEYFDDLKRRP